MKRDDKGRFKSGKPKNGLDKNPQNRGKGFWKKEDTPRYKLEQMMKLKSDELKKIATNNDAPLFERKLATCINNGEWKEIKEMIQEVYGRPVETKNVKMTQVEPLIPSTYYESYEEE